MKFKNIRVGMRLQFKPTGDIVDVVEYDVDDNTFKLSSSVGVDGYMHSEWLWSDIDAINGLKGASLFRKYNVGG